MKALKILDKDLVLSETETIPIPKDGEILIKTKYCALSDDLDVEITKGNYNIFTPTNPILGYEICGEVVSTGKNVTGFKKSDIVVAFLPIAESNAGCSEYCISKPYYTVLLMDTLNEASITSSILSGIRAYNVFLYMAHICGGENVLIINGADPSQYLSVQLALQNETFVYTTCSNDREIEIIQGLSTNIIILDTRKGKLADLIENSCFDLIIDNGSFSLESLFPFLDVKGKYFTSKACPVSNEIAQKAHFKSVSIGSFFDQIWVLAPSQSGRFLHILKKISDDISQGVMKAPFRKEVKVDQVVKEFPEIQKHPFQKLLVKFEE